MTESPLPWDNGLAAPSYVALTDLSTDVAPRVLVALQRSRIAAYLAQSADTADGRVRLYVAAAERADARTIVAAVVRTDAAAPPPDPFDSAPIGSGRPDSLDGIDTDAAFAALIADWHVDTHAAIRDAERDLTREDEDWRMRLARPAAPRDEDAWLDDDHYVPPAPPPLPRPTTPIVLGLLLVALSILLLALGGFLGVTFEARLFVAVCGILSATAMFVTRLRANRDEDDDGAIL